MKNMKIILVVILAVIAVLPASAQISLGVLGGLNIANLDMDEGDMGDAEFASRTVFGFGGILDYSISENIALRLEPMYLQKGADIVIDGYDDQFIVKLSYFEVPMMFKYSFSGDNINPYIMAGPSIGFLLEAKTEVIVSGVSEETDIKDETSNIDFSLGFGAGVSLPMGTNSIFVDARYALGLTNIVDDPDAPDDDVKNKGIQIFAGISFPVGG
ncbi:MAG: PorT family protein [Candidatus Aegiribacteria sp.]|nr:PorT family protein [Candidatus Aegiribacteria sp.]